MKMLKVMMLGHVMIRVNGENSEAFQSVYGHRIPAIELHTKNKLSH